MIFLSVKALIKWWEPVCCRTSGPLHNAALKEASVMKSQSTKFASPWQRSLSIEFIERQLKHLGFLPDEAIQKLESILSENQCNKFEEWKVPISFTERYEASNLGRVRTRIGFTGNRSQVILRQFLTKSHLRVVITKTHGAKGMPVFVHQLVADAFIGPIPAGLIINHKDGVSTNNNPENLEYVTDRQNKDHAIAMGLYAHGERSATAKLDGSKVREIRRRLLGGESRSNLAREFGVTHINIGYIARRETWNRPEYFD